MCISIYIICYATISLWIRRVNLMLKCIWHLHGMINFIITGKKCKLLDNAHLKPVILQLNPFRIDSKFLFRYLELHSFVDIHIVHSKLTLYSTRNIPASISHAWMYQFICNIEFISVNCWIWKQIVTFDTSNMKLGYHLRNFHFKISTQIEYKCLEWKRRREIDSK